MNLVLKIGFNFLHLYQHNPIAKSRYEELFKKDVEDFDKKINEDNCSKIEGKI